MLQGVPRIEDGHTRLVEIASVASHDRKVMLKRRRRNEQIGLGKNVSGLPPRVNQEPPLEHDVFRYLENPMFKHRSHLVREPLVQIGPSIGLGKQFDSKSDFSERNGTDKKLLQGTIGNESDNPRLRSRPPQFRQDVRIE